jgi:hypothetical protein
MINKIVDLNNQGAALLEIGYYKDALTVLNCGLVQLQSYLHNDAQESDDDLEAAIISDKLLGEPDNMEEDSPTARLDASRAFEQACSEKTARRPPREGESYSFREEETRDADLNQDFVYRHPIFIASESDSENETVLSIILVFNMALSHHLIAMDLQHNAEATTKRRIRLKLAVKLYKLGSSMQIESDIALSATYTLATVNNWAQISKVLNNEKSSKRLFNHLVTSLMIIIESGATDEIDEIDGFMGNASKMILRECSFAAAA